MVNEALHILRRIAEEQPHLVGEFPALPKPADKPCYTARAALLTIARLPQQLGRLCIPQVPPQLGRPVEVKERLATRKADWQQTKALR